MGGFEFEVRGGGGNVNKCGEEGGMGKLVGFDRWWN